MNTPNEALQAEAEPVEEAEDVTVEPAEEAPAEETNDNDPDAEQAPEKVSFTPEQQEVFDKAIGKKVGATRAAERKAEELAAQLADAQAKIPVEQRPDVPETPDPYAENYSDQVAARDKAIADRAAYDARQTVIEDQKVEQAQRTRNEQVAAVQTVVTTYTDRAKDMGIAPEDLGAAGKVVAAHGISDDVTLHILNDDKGPAITTYLAQNPLAMDELHGMNPMQAAIHIENVVKPAAVSSKKTTNAPPPSTNLEGGGSPPSERGPKGATFE